VFNFTARTLEAIEAVGGMDQVDVPPGLLTPRTIEAVMRQGGRWAYEHLS
jgi:hypothetical protein